jgi:aspartate dehydrogenase
MMQLTLIGFGAIAQELEQRLRGEARIRVAQVVVNAPRVASVKAQLASSVVVTSEMNHRLMQHWLDQGERVMVLECAAHSALLAHVVPALKAGFECALLSIGALSEDGLPQALEQAAREGHTQVHLLSGAVGAIDALAAAKLMGLQEVVYTSRKPPLGFKGTVAEEVVNLTTLDHAQVLLTSSARDAARLYPKNANVAATVSLAGLGLDATQVQMIADPSVTQNIHEIKAKGAFGEFHMRLMGNPLPNNPKTSTLTVLSALRFLLNQVNPLTV